MSPSKTYRFSFFFLLFSFMLHDHDRAQSVSDTSSKEKRHSISGIPVIFYTPETRAGIGASGVWLFKFKQDSVHAQSSSVYLGFAVTQNKQAVVNLPFNLFLKNRLYNVYGELGYNHLNFNFYGVGNTMPPDYVERYGIDFPRLRLTGLRRVARHLYAGVRYLYDKNTLYDLDSSGLLISGQIPGSQGGVVSGIGVVGMYDTRDNIFYPSKGTFAECVVLGSDEAIGSDFNYTRVSVDISHYIHFDKNILAFNLYSVYANSDLPLFQMANLGGMKKMRGFYDGRYRDNNLIVLQAEYRRHLFWLLGFTLFADVGQVAAHYTGFDPAYWRYTYGGGLRLQMDKKQKLNLRLDLAVGNNKLLTYFTIGEAF